MVEFISYSLFFLNIAFRMFSFASPAERRRKDVNVKLCDSFTGSELKGALYSVGLNV